jgi:hypothetical protein
MRDRTQARVEELAHERGIGRVDLECVEAGIAFGRQLMEQMITEHRAGSEPARREESARSASAHGSETQPRSTGPDQPLNEVRPISELAALRMLLTEPSGES